MAAACWWDPDRPAPLQRHPGDVLRIGLGGILFLVATLAAGTGRPGALERDLFRLINDLPTALEGPLAVVMQAGSLAAVPVTAALALVLRRPRAARDAAVAGTVAWGLARAFKLVVVRGRPSALLNLVIVRGGTPVGLGFPSGHAAVAAGLATAVAPYLGRRGRRAVWAAAFMVALARIYAGVHFPADVLGGLALGWVVGAAVHLGFGVETCGPSMAEINAALAELGLAATSLERGTGDGRASYPFFARSANQTYFVKVVDHLHRDADLLFKLWRFLAFREVEDEAPFATPKQQVEHEAFLALLAARAAVRTPALVGVIPIGPGKAALVEAAVDGRPLDQMPLPPGLLQKVSLEIWRQVGRLRDARIAHRDLRLANVLVDRSDQPWIIDFGFGEAGASRRRLAQDVAELLAALSCVAGPAMPVVTAIDVLGTEAVAEAVPLLQPLALSAATRANLRRRPGLLDAVRDEAARRSGAENLSPVPLTRVRARTLLGLVIAALAIHLLLPQVGRFQQTVHALRHANLRWIAVAAASSAFTYLPGATAIMAAAGRSLSLGWTLEAQLAGSFANRLTPGGLGGIGLNARYLERSGLTRADAMTAVVVASASGLLVHAVLLLATGVALGRQRLPTTSLPHHGQALLIVVVTLIGLGVLTVVWRGRRRQGQRVAGLAGPDRGATREQRPAPSERATPGPVRAAVQRAYTGLSRMATDPWRIVRLLLSSALVTAGYICALAASLRACGDHQAFLVVAAVYLGGTALAAATPTPGGVGAVEAALVAGLIRFGGHLGPVVAGVLIFRFLTYWLPAMLGFLAFRHLRQRQVL